MNLNFALTFLLAYILGLLIIYVVDSRLSAISINMPTIKVPQPRVIIKSGFGDNYQLLDAGQIAKEYNVLPPQEQQGGAPLLGKRNCDITTDRAEFNSNEFKSRSKKISQPPERTAPKANLGKVEVQKSVNSKNGDTNLQPPADLAAPTYYMDPSQMTSIQRLKFKNNAKFQNMTVNDYKNWLLLFKDDQAGLDQYNRKQLRKILKGGKLKLSDIPTEPMVPQSGFPTAEQQFDHMFPNQFKRDKAMTVDVSPYAYNFDDFDTFEPPKRLKHLSIVNSDETVKNNDSLKLVRPILSIKETKLNTKK